MTKRMVKIMMALLQCWQSEPPGRQIFATKCLRTALLCVTVVPHFIWCHILHSCKCYVKIFAIVRNENGIGRSPDQLFFPVWRKMVWEW